MVAYSGVTFGHVRIPFYTNVVSDEHGWSQVRILPMVLIFFAFLRLLRSGFFIVMVLGFFFLAHGDIALSGPIRIYENLLAFR